MGSSESHILTDNNENNDNIYAPNLLAKQIIGDIDSKKNEGIKINSNKSQNEDVNSLNERYININKQDNLNIDKKEDNNKYFNKNNDFDSLSNKNINNENDIITNINRNQYNKNIFAAHTAEVIKMEITNQKRALNYRNFKFNGITVSQNLKDYIPEHISREEIKDMIFNVFREGIVDDKKYYIPGKTITREQANAIVDLIENYIRNDKNVENLENDSILEGVNLTIDLVDINKEIVKKKMFKGVNATERQLENTIKNLTQGQKNVKLLSIEFQ